jgi:hypothetical protein
VTTLRAGARTSRTELVLNRSAAPPPPDAPRLRAPHWFLICASPNTLRSATPRIRAHPVGVPARGAIPSSSLGCGLRSFQANGRCSRCRFHGRAFVVTFPEWTLPAKRVDDSNSPLNRITTKSEPTSNTSIDFPAGLESRWARFAHTVSAISRWRASGTSQTYISAICSSDLRSAGTPRTAATTPPETISAAPTRNHVEDSVTKKSRVANPVPSPAFQGEADSVVSKRTRSTITSGGPPARISLRAVLPGRRNWRAAPSDTAPPAAHGPRR